MQIRLFLTGLATLWFCSESPGQQAITQLAEENKTPTYEELIGYYRSVAANSEYIHLDSAGTTDAGYPLHMVVIDRMKTFQRPNDERVVLLINNAIHPGEPDGVDACIRMTHFFAENPDSIPSNVVIVFIPIYNIGGALNRSPFSRANQNGPEDYGFRGNANNYDLNRDFIKQDSRNAVAFSTIFHRWQPELFIDTHVSNGADYQHVMTLVPTQHDKLSPPLGDFLKEDILPFLYKSMEENGFPMSPYVQPLGDTPDKGIVAFMDHPRYSTGYAALFNCIGFMTETHMLKPYPERVSATYHFIRNTLDFANEHHTLIGRRKAEADIYNMETNLLPLNWLYDLNCYDSVYFRGYTAAYKPSDVTGADRLYYDRSLPWEKNIPLYDHYDPDKQTSIPQAYYFHPSWKEVSERLSRQFVDMHLVEEDLYKEVDVCYITNYNTTDFPYEGHYRHTGVETECRKETLNLKGYLEVATDQRARRFIVEVLEPEAPDSYFSWNFFDPVLMQKEGYSTYVWEDLAARLLSEDPDLKADFEEKKRLEPAFAGNPQWQLYYIYTRSYYYEPVHNRYPVYKSIKE